MSDGLWAATLTVAAMGKEANPGSPLSPFEGVCAGIGVEQSTEQSPSSAGRRL